MASLPLRRFLSVVGLVALMAASGPAGAQWVWKDAGGHVIASDQPPPLDTPASRIIKQPRPGAPAPVAPQAEPAPRSDLPKSLADRDLDAKQQAKTSADAAKKAQDDAARAQAMQANCNAVRSNVAALQAGGRAARYNERGEKVYIDDSQRQDEINRQQAQVSQYCK